MNLYHVVLNTSNRPRCGYARSYVVAATSESTALYTESMRRDMYEYIVGLEYEEEIHGELAVTMHGMCFPITASEADIYNLPPQPIESVRLMARNVEGYNEHEIICVDYYEH